MDRIGKIGKPIASAELAKKVGLRASLARFVKYFKAHPFLYIMLIPGLFFLFI